MSVDNNGKKGYPMISATLPCSLSARQGKTTNSFILYTEREIKKIFFKLKDLENLKDHNEEVVKVNFEVNKVTLLWLKDKLKNLGVTFKSTDKNMF